jgi:hypothetical protein
MAVVQFRLVRLDKRGMGMKPDSGFAGLLRLGELRVRLAAAAW